MAAQSSRKTLRTQVVLLTGLAVFTLINLIPLIWAVLTSIKYPADAFSIPPTFIFQPTFEYHVQIWTERGFLRYLINSLIVSFSVVLISVPIGTLAAYALSRFSQSAARPILFGVFAIRMFPHMLLAVPFFVMGTYLNLIDSYILLVLAIVAINQPFTIWLMHAFFMDIPKDLDEAAAIDGCNTWQIFWKVILPLARPGLVVAALFSLLLSYNEFLFALVLTGVQTRTLPVAIASFGGEAVTDWSISAAAAVGIMAPIVLIMVFLQKHLVRGLTVGAVKG